MSMPRFKYTPLISATEEIRLLSLDPGGDLDDIRCTLATHRLDSRPVYCALSYEWGDPDLAVDIKVNGNLVQARHNLWLFLHRLKASLKSHGESWWRATFKLWIDALCIDQTDVAERNAQVQLMGRIYQNACGVIVWLGWADGLDPNVTLTLANQIADDPIYSDESYRYLSLTGPYRQIEPKDDPDATHEQICAFILQLCKKTYWTRRWIVQEILMAQRVLLVYGEQELPWVAVCIMFERYQAHPNLPSDSEAPIYYGRHSPTLVTILGSTAATIWRHQKMRKGSKSGISLATLLQTYRPMQCESVHDRVYALKGLTENELLYTDYSISPPELYSRVFSTILRQDRRAYRCWRDYAADCGLMVPPLCPTVATPQEHSNAVGASFCLKSATKGHVTSIMECKLCFEALMRFRGKYMEMTKYSAAKATDSLHKRLAGLLRFNWRGWDFSRTAVKSTHTTCKHGENVPIHSAILDRGDKRVATTARKDGGQPKEIASARPIIFVSRNHYSSTSHLLVSWSIIQLGDFLYHVLGNCYLILRRDGKAIELIGPAWMILDAEHLAELRLSVIALNEDALLFKDIFRQNVQLQGVMAQFDVMDLIRLLQVNEKVMEAAGLLNWDLEW